MIRKIYTSLIILVTLAALTAGVILWRSWQSAPVADRARLSPARVSEIKSMVELSTVDIYEEIPLKGSIGKRHLVARVALEGSVSFDLDSLRVEERGDTVKVFLPPGKVELRESTRPGSYEVIDVWNDGMFGSAHFTTAEENALKRRLIESAVKGIYRKGYVVEARRRAARNVADLLSATTGRPVVVVSLPQSML